jgi:hypothetical protein
MLIWMALGCAIAAPGRSAPARLAIQPAGRVDLGELGPMETRTQDYTFANASAAPISLRVLDLAPGVTLAGPALEGPIPPFASARLALRVDPEDWVGAQFRNVRLGTDDPAQGDYYLPVRMTVRPDLTVDGTRRTFGDVGAHESPVAVFSFARETGRPLTVRVAQPLPPYLECEVLARGPRARLACTLRPGRVRAGMRMGLDLVRVETNAPLQPGFDLYLAWRLHHPIEAIPARVLFQALQPDTLTLALKSRNGTPFRILEAELEGDGFQLGPLSPRPAPEQRLGIRRTAPDAARATLVLRFTGGEERLKVPVAFLPEAPSMDEGVIVVPNQSD